MSNQSHKNFIISLSNIAEKQLIVKYIKLLRINLQVVEMKEKNI